MAALEQLLNQMSHADLRAVATRLQLRQRQQHSKEQWAAAIAAYWLDPQRWRRRSRSLSPQAHAALMQLAEAGEIPAGPFWGDYGTVRRAAARLGEGKPWREPQNAAEELFYCGLLHPLGSRHLHTAARLQIATDLRRLLRAAPPVEEEQGPGESLSVLVHDAAQLLILLNSTPGLRLFGGYWLGKKYLPVLNARMARQEPLRRLRTHRRSPRFTLLAFLAAAGMLHRGGRLTPAGWAWLRLSPGEQAAYLWQAWRSAAESMRSSFGLASAGITAAGLDQILECLPGEGVPFTVRQFVNAFLGLSAGLNTYVNIRYATLQDLTRIVRRLLLTELAYLGVVRRVGDITGAARNYVVTRSGAELLQGRPPANIVQPEPSSAPAILPGDNSIELVFPAQAAPAAQAMLALFARHIGYTPPAAQLHLGTHCCSLTAETVGDAIAGGHGLPALYTALHGLGLHCSAEQKRQVATWATHGEAVRLRTVTLLETSTPEQLEEFLRQPRLAPLLRSLLRPTLAIVAGSSASLARELSALHYPVRGATPPANARRRRDLADSAAALWLAGMVYAEVGRFAPLPIPPPYTALAGLFADLTPAERAALEGQLAEITANLQRWLDHFSFAPPPEATDAALWLPVVQAALDTNRLLEMHYFSAGRNMAVRFVVEPYWLEEHHGELYLRGDPGAGASEAILFRLDRIQSLSIAGKDGGTAAG